MATKHYITSQLRRLSHHVRDMPDDDVLFIANMCQCGDRIFSDDEVEEFIRRSESAHEFLRLLYTNYPKVQHERD